MRHDVRGRNGRSVSGLGLAASRNAERFAAAGILPEAGDRSRWTVVHGLDRGFASRADEFVEFSLAQLLQVGMVSIWAAW